MAEFVQENIENMAEELHLLKETKLCSRKEIKLILAKRKHFEYKVIRKTRHLTDYLNYIAYESNLLSLVKLRRLQTSNSDCKEIELRIKERINALFAKACARFPGETKVWLARIQYCTAFGYKSSVSKLYRSMLRIISSKPNLWIMAANHEFEQYFSIELARNLLQEGIAINKNSAELWQEYFKLELMYVDMVRRLKEADEHNALALLPDELRFMDSLDTNISAAVEDGLVAEKVYMFARESLPDRFGMALEMAKINAKFPWATRVEKVIYADLLSRYSDRPLVTETICQIEIKKLCASEPGFKDDCENVEGFCNQLLKRLINENNSEATWNVVLDVKLALRTAALSLSRPLDSDKEFFALLDYIHSQGNLSLTWAVKWVDIEVKKNKLELLEKFVPTFKTQSTFWVAYLSNIAKAVKANSKLKSVKERNADHTKKMISTFHRARTALQSQNMLPLWKCILGHLVTFMACSEQQLLDLFELGVVSENEVTSYVKPMYMDWGIQHWTVTKARQLFDRLSNLNPVPEEMLVNFIKFERSQETPDNDRLRKIFEVYTTIHAKTSVDAWSGYAQFERLLGNGMKAAVVHSRAIKQLNPERIDEFLKLQIKPN